MAGTSVIKEQLFTSTDNITFALLTCLSVAVIVFFSAHWFALGDWLTHAGSFLILTFIVLFKVAHSLARWFTLPFMKRPRIMATRSGLKVAVVTTIVPEAESLKMLEETVRALVALDYPHDTWVLDEGGDDQARQPLPAVFGFPEPGFRMAVAALHSLREPMHTAFGQPRLVGNAAHALSTALTKTLENLKTFVPKSHVGQCSEG